MMEFLSQYGLFLAKTLTLVIGIVVTFAVLLALIVKAKSKSQEGTLVIESVNEKLDDVRAYLQAEALPKPALKKWLKEQKAEEKKEKKNSALEPTKGRLFVVRFDGDVRATEVENLREVITAILSIALDNDEVLIVLESGGGFVHSYGLAASQIQRLRQRKLGVTVAIDKVAASGGYMMACVANRIIAAPFAIVGSIGVVAQMPNFHRFLDKHNVDFELHTAGEYKRTLTLFGENTNKAREKFQEEINETHQLFKDFIALHRPIVNVNEVATGEHWHAIQAIELRLVDEILTSDDYILDKAHQTKVYEISYEIKQKLSERISGGIFQSVEKYLAKWIAKNQPALLR